MKTATATNASIKSEKKNPKIEKIVSVVIFRYQTICRLLLLHKKEQKPQEEKK